VPASRRFTDPPTAYFATVGDSRRRVQIGLSGWAADYPSPAAFLSPLFSCAGFVPANWRLNSNFSEFCDREVERRLKAARALQIENPPAATLAWQAAERAILERAPIVPLENMRNVDLVSRRLGNYQYSPQYGFLLDQAWVK
jgi:peptide/nickel transport system substrate-binding protein